MTETRTLSIPREKRAVFDEFLEAVSGSDKNVSSAIIFCIERSLSSRQFRQFLRG